MSLPYSFNVFISSMCLHGSLRLNWLRSYGPIPRPQPPPHTHTHTPGDSQPELRSWRGILRAADRRSYYPYLQCMCSVSQDLISFEQSRLNTYPKHPKAILGHPWQRGKRTSSHERMPCSSPFILWSCRDQRHINSIRKLPGPFIKNQGHVLC